MIAGALLVVLVVALVWTPAPAAGPPVVTNISVSESAGRLELGIQATGPIAYRSFTLGDPDRIVVDVHDATDGLPRDIMSVKKGPVDSIRVSQFTVRPPVVRVVLVLTRPAAADVSMAAPATVLVAFGTPRPTAAAPSSTPPAVPAAGGIPAAVTSGITTTPAPGHVPLRAVSAGPPGIAVVQGQIGTSTGPSGILLNLDLRNASLPDVIDALARLCGINIVTDSSVTGQVTIHLVGVTCEETLTFLLAANSLGSRRIGDTLIVQPAAKLAPPPAGPIVVVYRLQYLQPPVANTEPLVGSVGATSAGGSGVSGGAGPVQKNVQALVALFQGTGAGVGYDDRTNSLIVTGTPDQQAAVQALLRQLDVPLNQIVVQTLVVDITVTALTDLGVEWSLVSGSVSTPFEFSEVSAPPAGFLAIQPILRDALFAKIHLFEQQGLAKVLSDPQISTFDGQEALIFAGDQIPINNTTTAGNPPVTSETVTFQPIGVTLKVVPKVNADRTINVSVHPVVTTATSFTPPTPTNPSGLPNISIREAVTQLTVGNGDTIVIGGLMRYSDVTTMTKLPYLGDLPFIGALFRLQNTVHTETEVIILMTPSILATAAPASAPAAPPVPIPSH